jgi:hypothetical protein
MNLFRLPTVIWIGAVCLTLAGPVRSSGAQEAEGSCAATQLCSCPPTLSTAAPPPSSPLLASFWNNIGGDRRRMIQVGLVAVCVGFFFLSWSRK